MSKFTSLIKARFESVAHGQKEKQKGASALEYLVLAGVIVIVLVSGALFISEYLDGSSSKSVFVKIGNLLQGVGESGGGTDG